MLDRIKDTLTRFNKAAGIEIILLPDDAYDIRLIVVYIEKKKILIEKKVLSFKKLEELKNYILPDVPVSLTINGRGVLHKKVANHSGDDQGLLQAILSNAKISDFYLRKSDAEAETMVSLVRKDAVDKILRDIKKLGLYVVHADLGAMSAVSMLSLVSSLPRNSYKIAEHSYLLNPQKNIQNYSYSAAEVAENKTINIAGEEIEEQLFLCYAIACNLVLKNMDFSLDVEFVKKEQAEFNNKLLFKTFGWVVLIFFFSILVINYFLFVNFSKEHDALILGAHTNKADAKELTNLQKEVKEKDEFLLEAGWLGSSRVSYFADRIANSVPLSVKLTELSVYPMDEKKSKTEKKNIFYSDIIKLTGQSTKPTELNEWIEKIKDIERIKQAKLLRYSYDSKDNTGTFSVEIILEN